MLMVVVMVGEMMMVPFVLQSWTAHHNGDDVVIMLMAMRMVTAFCKAGLLTMMTMMVMMMVMVMMKVNFCFAKLDCSP